jgi:hypothetical protein
VDVCEVFWIIPACWVYRNNGLSGIFKDYVSAVKTLPALPFPYRLILPRDGHNRPFVRPLLVVIIVKIWVFFRCYGFMVYAAEPVPPYQQRQHQTGGKKQYFLDGGGDLRDYQ